MQIGNPIEFRHLPIIVCREEMMIVWARVGPPDQKLRQAFVQWLIETVILAALAKQRRNQRAARAKITGHKNQIAHAFAPELLLSRCRAAPRNIVRAAVECYFARSRPLYRARSLPLPIQAINKSRP